MLDSIPNEVLAMIGQALSEPDEPSDSESDSDSEELESTSLDRLKTFSLVNSRFRDAVLPVMLQNATIVIERFEVLNELRQTSEYFLRLVHRLFICDTGCTFPFHLQTRKY